MYMKCGVCQPWNAFFLMKYIMFSVSVFNKGLMMAHIAETCSRE